MTERARELQPGDLALVRGTGDVRADGMIVTAVKHIGTCCRKDKLGRLGWIDDAWQVQLTAPINGAHVAYIARKCLVPLGPPLREKTTDTQTDTPASADTA